MSDGLKKEKMMMAIIKMNKPLKVKNSRSYKCVRQHFAEWNVKNKSRVIEYNGQTHTIREWSEILEIPYNQFRMFFYRGYSLTKIMNKPVIVKATHYYNGKLYNIK